MKIKPKHEKLTSSVNEEEKSYERITAEDNPNQYKTHKTAPRANQRETTKDVIVDYSVSINP